MGDKTKIEWTRSPDGTPGASWNPITGCTKVSQGCKNCYALPLSGRLGGVSPKYKGVARNKGDTNWEWTGKINFDPSILDKPRSWSRPRMIFVNSMSDLFHEEVSFDFIDTVYRAMIGADHHIYQILTKRPKRMKEYLLSRKHVYDHIWPGVSVENQSVALERIVSLMDTPTSIRWISAEPLLGELDIDVVLPMIDWLVVGAESGKRARPMDLNWVRSLRDQCLRHDVAFFFKQDVVGGKKISLPELDGQVWNEYPAILEKETDR